jgi:hypothetical protein
MNKEGWFKNAGWLRYYFISTSFALGISGLMMLLAASGDERLGHRRDLLFNVPHQEILFWGGVLNLLLIGFMLLLHRRLILQLLLLLFWGWLHAAYLLMLYAMKSTCPIPVVRLVAWKFGESPGIINLVWQTLFLLTIAGSSAFLLIEYQRYRSLKSKKFIESWKELRKRQA